MRRVRRVLEAQYFRIRFVYGGIAMLFTVDDGGCRYTYWVRFNGVIDVVPDRVVERLRLLETNGELFKEVMHVDPYRMGVSVRVHLSVGDILGIVVGKAGGKIVVESPLCRCVVPGHLLETV